MSCHNKLRDGAEDLDSKALTPIQMHNDPLIHPSCSVKTRRGPLNGTHPPNNPSVADTDSEQKGTSWFGTCEWRGQTTFSIWESWIQTLYTTLWRLWRKTSLLQSKKNEVFGFLYLTMLSLSPLCCLSGWNAGNRNRGHAETPGYPPCRKVAETLLPDMWTCP